MNAARTLEERVRAIVVDHLDVEVSKVTPQTRMAEDLGADSLDMIELTMACEDAFDVSITDEEAEGCATFGDVLALIERRIAESVA